jgi:hypothetical protein
MRRAVDAGIAAKVWRRVTRLYPRRYAMARPFFPADVTFVVTYRELLYIHGIVNHAIADEWR